MISSILDREFESVETSSGFAQFLGENGDFQMMSEFFFVKLQKSRSERCDFTKKNLILLKVSNTETENERKICKLTVCFVDNFIKQFDIFFSPQQFPFKFTENLKEKRLSENYKPVLDKVHT